MVRAFSAYQLAFRVKSFTPKTIKALIFTEIDVALIINILEDVFHHCHMGWVRCPDEIIVLDIQFGPEFSEEFAYFINVDPGA